jgi:hypothetical protein
MNKPFTPALPPFQQGGLDSLCGLYSIVNAERIINQSSDGQAQELFNAMVRFLSKKRMLARILIDGVNHRQMLLTMQQVVNGRLPALEIPWRGVPTPDLDTFWQSMQAFLDGTPGRAIILGLNGYHDHWTVIDNITSKSILLYDSARIPRLRRSRCSTARNHRKHLLLPAQTYFLSKN